MSIDRNRAANRIGRMWWGIARLSEMAAVAAIEADNPVRAEMWAKLSERAYWQSTGDCDAISFNLNP
jgi:hypothetical protein